MKVAKTRRKLQGVGDAAHTAGDAERAQPARGQLTTPINGKVTGREEHLSANGKLQGCPPAVVVGGLLKASLLHGATG